MNLRSIDTKQAKTLIDEGAVLVDIREADEHARVRIPGARNHPLSGLSTAFVGAGLTFAGVSGWCGMAKLLAFMPWNRRATSGAA